MNIKEAILFVSLLSYGTADFAADMTVINHATKKDEWFYVVAYGAPTGYLNVGALGGRNITKNKIQLADDQYGRYKLTEVQYCIGSYKECILERNKSKFAKCNLQDTTKPINEMNAQVLVLLGRWSGCYAYIKE